MTVLQSIRQHLLERVWSVGHPLLPQLQRKSSFILNRTSRIALACSYVPSVIFTQWRLSSAELFIALERLGFAKLCPPLVMCGVELQVAPLNPKPGLNPKPLTPPSAT